MIPLLVLDQSYKLYNMMYNVNIAMANFLIKNIVRLKRRSWEEIKDRVPSVSHLPLWRELVQPATENRERLLWQRGVARVGRDGQIVWIFNRIYGIREPEWRTVEACWSFHGRVLLSLILSNAADDTSFPLSRWILFFSPGISVTERWVPDLFNQSDTGRNMNPSPIVSWGQ